MKLIHGDCIEKLKELEENSVDLLVTDPPYGYSFMGKDWDKAIPSIGTWKECFRVLKAGSFAFVMSAPRQDVMSHMIVNLEKAGFKTGFTSIYWTYATGFPKACNIGKMVDKRLGAEREVIKIEKMKRMASPKGEPNSGYLKKQPQISYEHTKASSPEAKELNGSYAGYQPKPAVEVVLVVMKPLSEKTYVEQALKNGKGITWLDACRIPYKNNIDEKITRNKLNKKLSFVQFLDHSLMGNDALERAKQMNYDGRFPANLLCSDDILNDGKIRKSGYMEGIQCGFGNSMIYGEGATKTECKVHNDEGSFSRFFNIDKWWEERLKELPKEAQKTFPFLIVPKASKSEKNKGIEKNIHPTVKPIKLVSYLITLGSRKGDVILDPFVGSGTTILAANMLERDSIGVEREEEYIEITKERIKHRQEEITRKRNTEDLSEFF